MFADYEGHARRNIEDAEMALRQCNTAELNDAERVKAHAAIAQAAATLALAVATMAEKRGE